MAFNFPVCNRYLIAM